MSDEQLFDRVAQILEQARDARTVNTAATYQMYLPTEAELAELIREREEAERMLQLTAPADPETDGEP